MKRFILKSLNVIAPTFSIISSLALLGALWYCYCVWLDIPHIYDNLGWRAITGCGGLLALVILLYIYMAKITKFFQWCETRLSEYK